MGVIIEELKVTLSLSPQRFSKSFILDMNNFVPKAFAGFIKSFESIEGDGGVGTIKLITYVDGEQIKTMKHKVEEIDVTNGVYKYTVFEGDIVDEDIEYYTNTAKFESGPNEGSVYTYTTEYHTKKNNDPNTLEQIKQRKVRAKGAILGVEAYLLANPQEYVV